MCFISEKYTHKRENWWFNHESYFYLKMWLRDKKTAHFGAFRDPIKKAMYIIAWYSRANITHFIALIGIKCKFGKVAPMKHYLKTPKIFRRSAPKIYRIRRKFHFRRPQKYTYLGAFGVKLKIKFSKKKKNNTICGGKQIFPVMVRLPLYFYDIITFFVLFY